MHRLTQRRLADVQPVLEEYRAELFNRRSFDARSLESELCLAWRLGYQELKSIMWDMVKLARYREVAAYYMEHSSSTGVVVEFWEPLARLYGIEWYHAPERQEKRKKYWDEVFASTGASWGDKPLARQEEGTVTGQPSASEGFLIVVMNRTSGTFSIHGPMRDDMSISERTMKAQLCGCDINCHNPGTLDESAVAAWAESQGLVRGDDATRTPELKGPWEVFDPNGTAIGRLTNSINFDLWFTSPIGCAVVKGDQVADHGRTIGYLSRTGGRLVYSAE
jgi:hypothetical protein